MKKWFSIFGIALISVSVLYATPVTVEEVEAVAEKFISEYHGGSVVNKIDRIIPAGENGNIFYYAVILEPSGWLLISADDFVQPVLGYSFESSYSDESSWNLNTLQWIKGYKEQIQYQSSLKSATRHADWGAAAHLLKSSEQTKAVEPLIEVEWDQGSGWNRYCPEDEEGPGGHTWVGCVAVAMAQAMHYYKYPDRPVGMHSYIHETYGGIFVNYDIADPYNWEEMSVTSSDTMNAMLLYHAAVAVDMSFGTDGSGTITQKVRGALMEHFGYPSGVMGFSERDEDDEVWKEILRDELDKEYPVIYDGRPPDDNTGHCFNIDGYEGEYFHLNWGWSGSMNGYFTIDNLAPGSYDFTSGQHAVTNIRPPIAGPKDITLTKSSVKENLPAGSYVARILVEDEVETNVYEYSLTGSGGTPIDLDKETSMFVLSGDSIKTNAVFDKSEYSELPVHIYVTDTLGNKMDKEFTITILENNIEPVGERNIYDKSLRVYPNPNDGLFTLSVPEGFSDEGSVLNIFSSTGALVYTSNLSDSRSGDHEIDLSDLNKGLYYLTIRSGDIFISEHIIVL